jgi:DNA-directed RNA polymerase
MQTSGWFEKLNMREGRKTVQYVVPTAKFMDIKDELMRNAELFSPLAWPMLIPPNDWSNEEAGGYILNEVMRGHDLVRRGHGGRIQGEKPLQFLNKIQKVPYCLNKFIVEVAEKLEELERPVGKFLPIVNYPLPPKPVDIAENVESRKSYRREAAEVRNKQAHEFRRSCRTRMTMEAVKRFKEKEKFYCPWSFDYRGRAYPIPAFLTPQDTDFGKSLLRSYEEAFMTPEAEEWLAFQVATTYGLDKAPMRERLQWVQDNITFIKRIALDPIGCLPDWESADEPWQFLAACEEYYA